MKDSLVYPVIRVVLSPFNDLIDPIAPALYLGIPLVKSRLSDVTVVNRERSSADSLT